MLIAGFFGKLCVSVRLTRLLIPLSYAYIWHMRKIQKHTQAEMHSHINDWKVGNLSQKSYCQQHQIALSTFQFWCKKYRKEYMEFITPEHTPGFIPIKAQPEPETDQVDIPSKPHFLFPNGIQVMCSESVDSEVLKTLLNS